MSTIFLNLFLSKVLLKLVNGATPTDYLLKLRLLAPSSKWKHKCMKILLGPLMEPSETNSQIGSVRVLVSIRMLFLPYTMTCTVFGAVSVNQGFRMYETFFLIIILKKYEHS